MTCTCEPYKPCAECEAISPYEECSTCNATAFDWPRCRECGSVDLGYLHSKIRNDWTVRVQIDADGKGGKLAA